MKYIVITDTHLGVNKSDPFYIQVVENVFEHVRETAKSRDIDVIVHLGDFFHNRKYLTHPVIESAHNIADIMDDFDFIVLKGNHDIHTKTSLSPSALSVFKDSRKIFVIDRITHLFDRTILCPWIIGDVNMNNLVPEEDKEGYLLLGHFEMNGIPLTKNRMISNGFEHDIGKFTGFGRVLSGHYHTPSWNEKHKIQYIGAPFHMDFNDAGPRGYYVVNEDNHWDAPEFIEFSDFPKFEIVMASEDVDDKRVTGNVVNLVFTEDYGSEKNMEIIDKVQEMDPKRLKTEFRFNPADTLTTESLDNIVVKRNKEILEDFIEKSDCPTHIDKPTLKELVFSFMEEMED